MMNRTETARITAEAELPSFAWTDDDAEDGEPTSTLTNPLARWWLETVAVAS